MESVFDNLPDGFFTLDPQFRCTDANPAALRWFGRARGALLGQDLWGLMSDWVGTPVEAALRRSLANQVTSEVEHAWVVAGGSIRLRIHAQPRGLAVLVQPLAGSAAPGPAAGAEQRLAEEALRISEGRLRVAVDAARLGTWERDLATGYMTCSARCKAHFGLPPDARFDYDDFQRAILPEDRDAVRRAVDAALHDRAPYRAEYRCVWPDGSVHGCSPAGTPSTTRPASRPR